MWYSLLGDLTMWVHFIFVTFVLFGALLTIKWPWMIWLHGPAVAWGVIVEFTGWICPLTPLENWFRVRAGEAGYPGDFLSRWLLPTLYPDALTPSIQLVLGGLVLVSNALIYACIWRSTRRGGTKASYERSQELDVS
jgi:Protein of Unknown function (DUF2784)